MSKLDRLTRLSYEDWKNGRENSPKIPQMKQHRIRSAAYADDSINYRSLREDHDRWMGHRVAERARNEEALRRKKALKKSFYIQTMTYKVAARTNILVPPNNDGKTEFWDRGFSLSRCVPFITSKDVVYDEGDVCYNPSTKISVANFPKEIMGVREANYFCFALPVNDRNIPVIFVEYDSVMIVIDVVYDEVIRQAL